MRLSTEADRDDERGLAVLCAAIDAGVTLHRYRRCVRARRRRRRPQRAADRARAGGAAGGRADDRDQGRADAARRRVGARRAREAPRRCCARVARRLGGAPIDLYLLHAIDPSVALVDQRARAREAASTTASRRAIGLSNVIVTQLEEASRSPTSTRSRSSCHRLARTRSRRAGRACDARGIRSSPTARSAAPPASRASRRDPVIAAIAARLGAPPPGRARLAALAVPAGHPAPRRDARRDRDRSARRHAVEARALDARGSPSTSYESGPTAGRGRGEVVMIMACPPPASRRSRPSWCARLPAAQSRRARRHAAKLAATLDGALAGGARPRSCSTTPI